MMARAARVARATRGEVSRVEGGFFGGGAYKARAGAAPLWRAGACGDMRVCASFVGAGGRQQPQGLLPRGQQQQQQQQERSSSKQQRRRREQPPPPSSLFK